MGFIELWTFVLSFIFGAFKIEIEVEVDAIILSI
jgi:hypothetical protein